MYIYIYYGCRTLSGALSSAVVRIFSWYVTSPRTAHVRRVLSLRPISVLR